MLRTPAVVLTTLTVFAATSVAQTTQATLPGAHGGFNFAECVRSAGDVNGDGVLDIIAGGAWGLGSGHVRVFSGSDGAVLFSVGSGFEFVYAGRSVDGIGDVTGDGLAEVVIGAPEEHPDFPDPGHARVYDVSTGAIVYSLVGTLSQDRFGTSCAGIGDVNADGIPDFAIGAPRRNSPAHHMGAVDVYSGATGVKLYSKPGSQQEENFGHSVAAVGDVDLDGVVDLIAGGPREEGALPGATVAVVLSGVNGTTIGNFFGSSSTDAFGFSVTGTGDADFDGVPDFAVGAPGFASQAPGFGSARWISGNTGGTLYAFTGAVDKEGYGMSVAGLGDVDQDGFMDLAVGAPSLTIPGSGRVEILTARNGMVMYEPLPIPGEGECNFGRSVAVLGDLTGDGRSEMAVGISNLQLGPSHFGAARVFSIVPGLREYGIGTPGCSGVHRVDGAGVPKIGNSNFAIQSMDAAPLTLGLTLVGNVANEIGADTFGLNAILHVDLLLSTELLTFDCPSDVDGIGSAPAPIPNSPVLTGATYFAQTLWAWPTGPCTLAPLQLSSSRGLAITIQP